MIEEKLPDITDFARIYQGVEPLNEPVPIQPTAHYAMGGIPTDVDAAGRSATSKNTVVPGPVRRRRVRLRQRPRRQPAGHQLAGGHARLRPAGRPPDGRATSRGVELPDAARATPTSRSGPSSRRSRDRPSGENAGRASARELADVMMDNVGVYRDARRLLRGRWPRSRELEGALQPGRASHDNGHGLQHRPARGPRAGLPARLRRGDGRRRRWPARRAAAPTPARTTPSATTSNWLKHTLAYRAEGGPTLRVQAGHDHPVRAQAADVLRPERTRCRSTSRILRYDPERDARPALGGLHGRGRADGPRPRPAPQGQVRAGRHADLPALLRPRRLRLGRDADQRPQPAGLQDPGRPARASKITRRAAARACRWSRTWSSTWTASSPSTAASSRT